MQLHNRCGEPAEHQKASNNPNTPLTHYSAELNDAYQYWQSEIVRAKKNKDGALLAASQTLYGYLGHAAHLWNAAAPGGAQQALEQGRRLGLSAIAISMLWRNEWQDAPDLPEGTTRQPFGPQGETDWVLDMIVDVPENWQDFRVHA